MIFLLWLGTWAAATLLFLFVVGLYGAHVTLNGDHRIPLTTKPDSFGLPYEAVEFKNGDGLTLKGWFVPAPAPSARTILLCHGWGANKGEIMPWTRFLRELGYNLFYFDFRSCGESEGDILTVGYLEARDFDAAVEFLKTYRPKDSLAVYGLSMGAMVSFCGLARHKHIKAAVLESIFTSHDKASYTYARVKKGAPAILIFFVLFWIRRRLGADPDVSSPERVAHLVDAPPILGLTGDQDAMATPELCRSLFSKTPALREFWVVPGGRHGKCWEAGGAAYQEKLAAFYAEHL